jgi:hypothetical protein
MCKHQTELQNLALSCVLALQHVSGQHLNLYRVGTEGPLAEPLRASVTHYGHPDISGEYF